jgi:hypothetical protein
MSQVIELHSELHGFDVLVSDRGLCSYVYIVLVVQGGVHAAFRVHQKYLVDFTLDRPYVNPVQGRCKG